MGTLEEYTKKIANMLIISDAEKAILQASKAAADMKISEYNLEASLEAHEAHDKVISAAIEVQKVEKYFLTSGDTECAENARVVYNAAFAAAETIGI